LKVLMTKQLMLLTVSLFLFLQSSRPAFAQSRPTDFRELEKVVLAEMHETNTPGATVAIVSGDRIIYAKGFGTSNIETGAPLTPDMNFFLASTTKMMTAATLISLAEENKIPLDQPIGNYVKGLGPRLSRVTINQLLSHTAGLINITAPGRIEWHDENDIAGFAAKVRAFKDDDFFLTEPGRVFSYANTGYALAGFLIQELTHRPYWKVMRDRLFKPLGMNHSTFQPTMAMTLPLSQGHQVDGTSKPTVVRPFYDDVAYRPGGFAYTSVNDLSRFAIALLNGGRIDGKQVLSTSVIAALTTPQVDVPLRFDIAPRFFENTKYGLGCFLQEHRGVHLFEHAGADTSSGSLFVLVPEKRFAVIILANKTASIFGKTAEKAMELMLPLTSIPVSDLRPASQITPAEMRSYAGTYRNGTKQTVLLVKDGQLFLTDSYIQSPDRLMPVTKIGMNRFAFSESGQSDQTEFILIPGSDGSIEFLFRGLVAAKKVNTQSQ